MNPIREYYQEAQRLFFALSKIACGETQEYQDLHGVLKRSAIRAQKHSVTKQSEARPIPMCEVASKNWERRSPI